MGNVKNEVQKIVILQLSMIFKLICVHLHLHLRCGHIAQSLSESPPRKSKEHLQFLLGAL